MQSVDTIGKLKTKLLPDAHVLNTLLVFLAMLFTFGIYLFIIVQSHLQRYTSTSLWKYISYVWWSVIQLFPPIRTNGWELSDTRAANTFLNWIWLYNTFKALPLYIANYFVHVYRIILVYASRANARDRYVNESLVGMNALWPEDPKLPPRWCATLPVVKTAPLQHHALAPFNLKRYVLPFSPAPRPTASINVFLLQA